MNYFLLALKIVIMPSFQEEQYRSFFMVLYRCTINVDKRAPYALGQDKLEQLIIGCLDFFRRQKSIISFREWREMIV